MASWKKHFRHIPTKDLAKPLATNKHNTEGAYNTKYATYLPEYYSGSPNRLERYKQYDEMDADALVNMALDTIADFCTQSEEHQLTPFKIINSTELSETESIILNRGLVHWCKINDLNSKIWRIIRNIIKYGDQFFIRDPETLEWYWVDNTKIDKVSVDPERGKVIEEYLINDLDFNYVTKVATIPRALINDLQSSNTVTTNQQGNQQVQTTNVSNSISKNYGTGGNTGNKGKGIPGKHMIHLSLSEGMDANWPFGTSILDSVFKVFRQKTLLEDAIIIYRVQRAPERRVFYVDVGDMPPNRAMAYVERIKTEIHQRRIPTRSGGQTSILDSSYNPLSMLDDFFFAQSAEGRGSRVDTLPGGQCISLDTKISLLDGRELPLSELIKEYENGKQNWVYSCNPKTGEIVPGIISWAGITRKNTKVIKIILDNNESIICTPDHKIPVKGKGFIEAQYITKEDSLIPLYRKKEKIRKNHKSTYEQIFQNNVGKWEFTHIMVKNFMKDNLKTFTHNEKYKDSIKNTVHHVNYNRYDNTPENLVLMNNFDHINYHKSNGFSKESQIKGTIAAKNKIQNMSKEEYDNFVNTSVENFKLWRDNLSEIDKKELSIKISDGIKNYFANATEEQLKERNIKAIENLKDANNKLQEKLSNDDEFKKNMYRKISNTNKIVKNTKEYKQKSSEIMKNLWKIKKDEWKETVFKNQKIKYDNKLLIMIKSKIKTYMKCDNLIEVINNDNEIINYFYELNIENNSNFKRNGFKWQHLKTVMNNNGFKNYKHFISTIVENKENHKIIEIIELDELMDTGTLSIDTKEEYHDYHTFALTCGIFVKNSIGETSDLDYFNNNLKQGLRIPYSYIPNPSDPGANYTDGRVGTAYIQEYRFALYCKRIQMLVHHIFDREFKLYIKKKEYNIDVDSFQIQFHEPQNFKKYRQMELDNSAMALFTQAIQAPFISKEFALKRFLGWTDEEIKTNMTMWMNENGEAAAASGVDVTSFGGGGSVGLDSVGINPEDSLGGDETLNTDTGGTETTTTDTGTGTAAGGTAASTPDAGGGTNIIMPQDDLEQEFYRYGIEFKKNSWYYKDLDDTRKPKLTLKHLNKLKKIKAAKNEELEKKQKISKLMYGAPPDDQSGGPSL